MWFNAIWHLRSENKCYYKTRGIISGFCMSLAQTTSSSSQWLITVKDMSNVSNTNLSTTDIFQRKLGPQFLCKDSLCLSILFKDQHFLANEIIDYRTYSNHYLCNCLEMNGKQQEIKIKEPNKQLPIVSVNDKILDLLISMTCILHCKWSLLRNCQLNCRNKSKYLILMQVEDCLSC